MKHTSLYKAQPILQNELIKKKLVSVTYITKHIHGHFLSAM